MSTLLTERLCLRPFADSDFDALVDLYRQEAVYRWLGSGNADTPEQSRERLALYQEEYPAPLGIWAIGLRDKPQDLLGTLLLKPIPFSDGIAAEQEEVEIGWHLHPDYWGQGFATEAAQAVLAHGRAHGLQRVIAVTYPDNHRSQALMRRLGMHEVGLTRRFYNLETLLFVCDFRDSDGLAANKHT